MKLSKNSYTYRIIDEYWMNKPSFNICGLFWQLIMVHLLVFAIAYVITSPLIGAYTIYSSFVVEGEVFDFLLDAYGGLVTLQGIFGASLIIATAVVFGGGYVIERSFNYINRKWENINKRTTRRTNVSIFKEYIKAKKNKVCTMIKWEDE